MLSALRLGLIAALVVTLAMITISIFNMTEALKKTYQVSAHLDAAQKTARAMQERFRRFEVTEEANKRVPRPSSTSSETN